MTSASAPTPSAFVIEVMHRTAGLAVSERGGFRFHASDPLFRRIDGHKFRKLKAIHTAVADLIELARAAETRNGSLAKFAGHAVPGGGDADLIWWQGEAPAGGLAGGRW